MLVKRKSSIGGVDMMNEKIIVPAPFLYKFI